MSGFIFIGALLGELFALPLLVGELIVRGVPAIGFAHALGVLYLGAFPTLLAMLLFGYGVIRVGALQAGIFTHLVPVFTAVVALVIRVERFQPFHAAGVVLV